jgi:hypothetical protein
LPSARLLLRSYSLQVPCYLDPGGRAFQATKIQEAANGHISGDQRRASQSDIPGKTLIEINLPHRRWENI